MIRRIIAPLRRVAAMDGNERRFRAASELRKAATRLRWTAVRPGWRRESLPRILSADARSGIPGLAATLKSRDWMAAHTALARHFASRPPAFPLDPRALPGLSERIRARFPDAAADSAARAARILDGRYDLLGYEGLPFGSPPRWDHDPVHHRQPPAAFWSQVPYLDPAFGDHKIIWELNRHQHWLALARAFHLSGDRRYYEAFVPQLESWLAANPPLTGINWASMLELAFRALSWLWALHLFAPAAAEGGDAAPWIVDLLVALDRQLTHVEHNLSRYFSPNTHLSGEALALYVAGIAVPELAASRHRAGVGRAVLLEEIERQIRSDGGHAELSAHYHRYSTEFYLLALLVARAGHDGAAARFEAAARAQAGFLRTLADDRGRLPLLGDDDGGLLFPIGGREPADARDALASAAAILADPSLAIGEPPEETFWLCGSTMPLDVAASDAVRWGSRALPATGYYVSRTPRGDHLILDAGPHGFLNGGHAHADALSVVLTVGGHPLLVDPGTATYTMDPEARDRFRSTAMHNTVVVNGRPQSEPRGPFHWRTRTDAAASMWRAADGFDYVEARHAAYAPLVHARGVLAVHGVGWFVLDHLAGQPGEEADARAETYWHLHPDWTPAAVEDRTVHLKHREGLRLEIACSDAWAPLSSGHADRLGAFAPVYGRVERAACLRTRTDGAVPRSALTFIPAGLDHREAVSVERLAVAHRPGEGWHSSAFRVRVNGIDAILLAALEIEGAPTSDGAAPGALWGTDDARTDGRVALILSGHASGAEAILINGRRIATPDAAIELDASAPATRVPLPSRQPSHMASTMHSGNGIAE